MSNRTTRLVVQIEPRRLVSVVVCLAVTGLLLISAVLLQSHFELGSAISDGVPPDMPLAVEKTLGVNVDLSRYDLVAREEALADMEEAGFHWLRQEFPWQDIEIHGKGDFEDRRHEPYRSSSACGLSQWKRVACGTIPCRASASTSRR